MPIWVGPLMILKKVAMVEYKLELLVTMKIHNVFHVSLLEPHNVNGMGQPLPPPILEDDIDMLLEVEHVVESFVKHSG